MKKKAKFEIRRAHSEMPGFYFRVVAPNGRIIVTSEVYSSKPMCMRGIVAVANAVRLGAGVVDLTLKR